MNLRILFFFSVLSFLFLSCDNEPTIEEGDYVKKGETIYYKGEKSSKNPEFVHLVAEANVRLTIEDIRIRSEVLRNLEEEGKIKIVGALYDMDTGTVEFLD